MGAGGSPDTAPALTGRLRWLRDPAGQGGDAGRISEDNPPTPIRAPHEAAYPQTETCQGSWTGTLPEPPRCEWGYSAPPGHGNRESWWAGQESTSLETDARPGTVWARPRVGFQEAVPTKVVVS